MSDARERTAAPWGIGGTFMPGTPQATVSIWGPTPPGKQSGNWIAKDVRPADAPLIIAAPDLLLACKELLVYIADLGRLLNQPLASGEPTKRAWATIAKAEPPHPAGQSRDTGYFPDAVHAPTADAGRVRVPHGRSGVGDGNG